MAKFSESELMSLCMEKVSLASSFGVPDLMAESMEVMKLEKPFFMDSSPELISLVRLGTASPPPVRLAALRPLFEADEIDCVWDCPRWCGGDSRAD